ncbi:MAG: hypothetical protein QOD75_943 [Blastocatellia bacterium]|nr:hypothetical protein [Blastocatellia bacterium]
MTQYVAFLRGINVGGKKLIKMEALRALFESMGFKNVRTFIQSGNVIFESAKPNVAVMTKGIEKGLADTFGFEVKVTLRTLTELEEIIRLDPFSKIKAGENVVIFVALLFAEPENAPKLPWHSEIENLDVLAIKHRAAFILCRQKKNGLFSFPNNFLEKQFGVSATTRNWATMNKIVAAAKSGKSP